MEAAAHGHEKKHESHEAKSSKWFTETMKAVGIGLAVFALAPALLPAAGIIMPAYMYQYLAVGAGSFYLGNKLDGSAKGKTGGHSKGGH